ncbi:Spermidine hydroxycinnamoyl transferase [Thalictrum thalictroides]|uniref:Spermidine hydroxycinnamoyl transferase n=1 Tax=Thalictrum thalictroides TaxID=46969 RepID=A0A7J6WLN6_THATH|nr:Spermidine hydroxycinnamoyl transferase [Thalictrum thalictroides]
MFASEFNLHSTHRSIVRAADTSIPPYTLSLSNLDLLSGRSPVIVVFVYTKPQDEDFSSILEIIKTSLSQTLNYYFPFAGRVVSNPTTNDPEILCNNQGVEVIEAHANIDLASLDFYDTEKSLKHITIPLSLEIPLCMQVTSFTCGGFSISWTFDHILVDATAVNLFLVTWSKIVQKKPISNFPDHQRLILKPRSPPTYCPLLDKTFTKCSMEMILNTPMAYDNSIKRLYFIEGSDVSKLQQLASQNGEKRTKLEAISGYLWKVMATALKESDTHCKMGWLVEGRRRMLSKDISNLTGNVLSMAVGEASMEELNNSAVSKVATIAHKAISEVTTEEHFWDLIDWIEHHKPGMFLAKILIGISGPALIVSSSRQFPSMKVELGFGPPLLGTYYTSLPRLGAGFVIPQPSSRGDGSWVVFAIVWPKLAAALE